MDTKINKPNAVGFLIFYVLMGLVFFGLVYGIMSDARDKIVPIYQQLSLLSPEYADETTQWGFDVLNFLFSFTIVFCPLGLVYYAFVMAQKPEQAW